MCMRRVSQLLRVGAGMRREGTGEGGEEDGGGGAEGGEVDVRQGVEEGAGGGG
jgi:hypothetical protein